ncbi:aminobenzoyl-glutamate utilization protein A [Seinonella peptonophila]|uniref:Aminobenzoyl-glutamate utilization protein A n=1 Tax=Seinonella peptonophila TaxID=112248 RepID=A0A1M4SQC5_9BACL|nr:amidohydrolase [Seinonella peptonophila]SHE34396.1 aminobenzoyl-glutamate utilization protein A [Seinonella peptonophila]
MKVVEWRREFHRYPEIGFTEFFTASKVIETLRSLGFSVLYGQDAMDGAARFGVPAKEILEKAYHQAMKRGANPALLESMKGGYTAVVGILQGKESGPTLAYRFELDALPIEESQSTDHLPHRFEFRSRLKGQMHACGHDAHLAIGLGVAEKIADRNFAGTIKLIFQPAEEGVRGARSMIEKGIVDDVDLIICQHIGMGVPTGQIQGGVEGFLATTKLEVTFLGEPAHAGAAPEKGKNALLGATTAFFNIQSLGQHSGGKARINVGVLEGGTAANIIPATARMVIETRADQQEVNQELVERVYQIIASSAMMHRLEYSIEIIGEATTFQCDEELVSLVLEEAEHIEGFTSLQKSSVTAEGSEDASLLIRRVQERGGYGTYCIIGSDLAAPHHHAHFDIHEEVLPHAVQLLERIARRDWEIAHF